VADDIDAILRGSNPADIPIIRFQIRAVDQPKTANALGLAVPPTLLTTADKVVE